mmetsp:Transcript_12592/g.34857  ORF Transcript_12592/g.34857 Transcript_12592/m.34857 type:complete len:272 (-) Transcript_12592:256-1071(-)
MREVELEEVEPWVFGTHTSGNVSNPYQDENTQEALTADERQLGLILGLSSCPDVVMSCSIIAVALVHAYRDNGVSLYCLSIQAFAHGLSSFLLILRFIGEFNVPDVPTKLNLGLLGKERRSSLIREQRLSLCMGLVMVISSVALLFKAFRKAIYWSSWYSDHLDLDADVRWATLFLAVYGSCIYTLHAFVRYFVWLRLRRSIIWQGFITSVISLFFLGVLAVAAGYEKEWSWKVEPVTAILLSFVAVFHAAHIISLQCMDVDVRMQLDSRA